MLNKSFTLIEVLIAVTLITAGVVGAFSIVQKVVGFTSSSSFRLTAAYLSQEGIEIVKNIRDTNWLEGAAWDDGLTSCNISPFCEVDYTNTQFLDPYADRFLKISPDPLLNKEFYTYSGTGAETRFKREIIITPEGSDILHISVTVSWSERTRQHEISVQQDLYNYR
jgi:Tfp pilus assembly protein PilV